MAQAVRYGRTDCNCRWILISCDVLFSQNLPQNQCLFIRGFRAKRRLRILPRRLRAAAEPKPDSDREPEMELVPIPRVTEVSLLFDPF